ncbi:MAG: type II toxin-antitoxin system Phd/YefM family antitoxin [Peptostreptococcaceae bacterium]|nr:type II toxin-antitoxin system Phd/YefM family antitoxin [Peptostreptococcaceae bacterium]
MINIRPVSDLRNKFPEIEDIVVNKGEPVYLTKNGYGSLVVLSLEQYAALTDEIELKLNEADRVAESTTERYSHEEVFGRVGGEDKWEGKNIALGQ